MKSSLKNMIIVLSIITIVAAVSVGGIYILTKDAIANAKDNKVSIAIKQVLPDFDKQEKQTINIDEIPVNVYTATKGSEVVGYAVEAFDKNGFSGMVKIMVGMLPDGSVSKISVVEHKETPGLGDKIEPSKSDFSKQFEGKSSANMSMKVKKDGGDVDAITASTITSRAYCRAVEQAFETVKKLNK